MNFFSRETIPAWVVAGLAITLAGAHPLFAKSNAQQSTAPAPQIPANMHCAVARQFGNMRFAAILSPGGVFNDELLIAEAMNTLKDSRFTPMVIAVKLTPTKCRLEDIDLLDK